MGLQYFTGFEDGTLLTVSEYNAGYTNVTTTPRTGARCMSLPTSSDGFAISFPDALASDTDAVIVGFGMLTESLDQGSGQFFSCQYGGLGAYVGATFQTGTGNIVVGKTNTPTFATDALATSSGGPIKVDTWHYLEFRIIFSNTVGVIEVHVDGQQVINLTAADTIQTGSGQTSRTVILRSPGSAHNILIDDVYLLDPTGESAPFNTFLGPVGVERIVPDGDSLTTNWTSSGANFFGVLDEVPVSNVDYADGQTQGSDLRMTMTNRAEGGDIIAVKPHAFAEINTGTGPRDLATFVRSDPGGTPTDSTKTGQAVPVGEIEVYSVVLDDPDTAADWTDSGINGAEVGIEITG